ncbi:MAG: serine hydrolase [Pseudomonadota bacterium]
MLKKFAIGFVVLLLGAAAFVYVTNGPVARAGSGYAAKNICSGYFLSGLTPEVMRDEALAGASDILANVSYDIDEDQQHVTTRLFGLFERRAVFTPGIGCTLLPSGEKQTSLAIEPLPRLDVSGAAPWPSGSLVPDVSPRFDALLQATFNEEDPERPRNTKAIVVVHEGKLVAEKYADGVAADTPLIGWSMAKSITALMVGVLVKDGTLDPGAAAPVPAWRESEGDPRAAITLDQLLRMSSGLEFNETYSAATDVTHMLSNEPDAAAFAADKPPIGPPDTIWSYSSGTTNIVSAIVKRSVGDTLQAYYDFSQKRLFRPLGISTATFEADASGTFIGSSYLYASARDWARLGLFCLQDGVWDGEALLPEGWIDYVTAPTPTTTSNEYGAHFWLNRDPDDASRERMFPLLPEDAYYMGGFQGQLVLVIPSEDLVITRFGFTPARNHGVEELAAEIIAQLNEERERG